MTTYYFFSKVVCPECGALNNDVCYAPPDAPLSRDFKAGRTHKCGTCGHEIDMEEYSGIPYEDASKPVPTRFDVVVKWERDKWTATKVKLTTEAAEA